MMTQRERYLAVALYQEHDKIPFDPGGARMATVKAWRSQGLAEGVNYRQQLVEELDLDPRALAGLVSLPMGDRMIPQFPEKVLEKKEHSFIVQDWKGNICEISDQHDVTQLRNPVGFVTRRWIKCPVETREDWEQMKERYDANAPVRFPDDFAQECKRRAQRDFPLELVTNGPFAQVREWTGFEPLCFLLYDDPALVVDMVQFWDKFISNLLMKTFQHVVPDVFRFKEDMGHKMHSMISPAMVRKYIAPCWKHWEEIALDAGVPVRRVHCDGYIHDLVPIWVENGINMCDPIEVAAGNDLPRLRREWAGRMAFSGGVDKQAIARGGAAIQQEMARVSPALNGGGYIPGCDHGVPDDVSWPNFVAYSRLLARQTGWLG